MADEDRRESPDSEDEGPPATPFDNPFFLPVLFWAFAVWFGYDAFINTDEHMQTPSTLWFNRIGFPIVTLLAAWFTVRAVRENRAAKENREE